MRKSMTARAVTLMCLGLAIAGLALTACKSKEQVSSYVQYNLVADTSSMQGARIDARLLNAWGIAPMDDRFAVAANHSGLVLFYNGSGTDAGTPITVPSADGVSVGAPSGIVRNTGNDIIVPGTSETATLLIASEDGLISAWASGTNAVKAVDRSADGAVYKGITIATDGSEQFIYAANFKGKKIDVFDKTFNYVTSKPFSDPNIPANYGPFNIRNIGGLLYVSYAIPKPPDYMDDSAGAGNGFVDVYNTNGGLVKRFVSQGLLNSPWGLAEAKAEFGEYSNTILVGNFGDGHINAYDVDGKLVGQLKDRDGNVVMMDGLWDITFTGGVDPDKLFTSSGPSHENHGSFAYLKME
jgi:uncharacterized protein (TIGR03118 family)